jgi:signal transduction histidine kinase
MLLVTLVLVAVLTIAGALVYVRVTAALTEELRASIAEDYVLIQDAQDRAGEQGVAQFINWASATRSAPSFAFGLFTDKGDYLAGNIDDAPGFTDWGTITLPASDETPARELLAHAGLIGDHIVVVARTDDMVSRTGNAVLAALAIAGLIVAMSGLLVGYIASHAASLKLRRLALTLESVAAGNIDVRLPVSARNDQFDYVSREINGYLDRLAELMASLRNTAIAIAHDLKTPLNRVSILLQTAASASTPEQVALYLEQVHDEMDRLKDTLDTILRISRIESSDDTAAFALFDMPSMLADLAQTFEPVVEDQQQSIRYIAPTTPVSPAFGDRRMLQQLLVNLIENATRYAGPGAAITLAVTEGAGAPVVSVTDTGPGIPADKRDAVFEPFFRMNPERNELGTGLGLAMVKAIATRHRASVILDDAAPGLIVRLALAPAAAVLPQSQRA